MNWSVLVVEGTFRHIWRQILRVNVDRSCRKFGVQVGSLERSVATERICHSHHFHLRDWSSSAISEQRQITTTSNLTNQPTFPVGLGCRERNFVLELNPASAQPTSQTKPTLHPEGNWLFWDPARERHFLSFGNDTFVGSIRPNWQARRLQL